MTSAELKKMAKFYLQARDELRIAFEQFSADERREFKKIFGLMQQNDREFIRRSEAKE